MMPGEIASLATVRKFRVVQKECSREAALNIDIYS